MRAVRFPGWQHMSHVARRNARMHEIFEQAGIHKQATAFEPIRPLRAPDNEAPYYVSAPLHAVSHPYVDYGSSSWPSRSYWLVPLQT